MYDLIGDIHGHADTLQQLLAKLGYAKHKGVYRHPDRQAIFLGDFIDRGPKIRETLEIVRPMIDSGAALAVMGNPELNALAFHTPDPEKPGSHLRPHNEAASTGWRAGFISKLVPHAAALARSRRPPGRSCLLGRTPDGKNQRASH